MTPTLTAEARAFVDAVRAELADLPDDDVVELLEDVEQHLAEAAADGRLAELGSPVAYAAELRAAAGLPARQSAVRTWAPVRAARRWGSRIGGTRAYREVAAFAPELRPAWWVLRGYLAVVALALLTSDTLHDVVPVPTVSGSALLGLAAVVAAVVASVAWGRRRATYGRRDRYLTVGANAAATVTALIALANVSQPSYSYEYVHTSFPSGLHGPHGQVTDILPYDASGQPLDGVRLFDQDGNLVAPMVCDAFCPKASFPLHAQSHAPIEPEVPWVDSSTTVERLPAGPPPGSGIGGTTPSAQPTPTPTPTATPKPTPTPKPTAKPTPRK